MYVLIIVGILALGLDAYLTYLICVNTAWFHFYSGVIMGYPIFLLIYLLFVVFLFIWGLFFNKKKETTKPNMFYYGILRQTDSSFLSILRIKIIFRGQEKMPKGRYLIIQNHRSNFDQMVMLKAIKEHPLVCVTKPENMDFPIAGPFIHHSGFIPINRDDMREGIKATEKAASYIEKDLASIAISPEGTRNKTDSLLLPFHPGSFNIAYLAKCPIVVSSLKDTDKIKNRAFFRRTKVYFSILEVIPYEKYKDMKPSELATYCRDLIYLDLKRREHF